VTFFCGAANPTYLASRLEIVVDVATPKGLNVKRSSGTLIATDEIGGTSGEKLSVIF